MAQVNNTPCRAVVEGIVDSEGGNANNTLRLSGAAGGVCVTGGGGITLPGDAHKAAKAVKPTSNACWLIAWGEDITPRAAPIKACFPKPSPTGVQAGITDCWKNASATFAHFSAAFQLCSASSD